MFSGRKDGFKINDSTHSKAMKEEDFAIALYLNMPERFNALTIYERASIAWKHYSLARIMVTDSNITRENIQALTTKFPQNSDADEAASALKHHVAIMSTKYLKPIASFLDASSPIFKNLDSYDKAFMARENINIAYTILQDISLLALEATDISSIVTFFSLDNSNEKNEDLCLHMAMNRTLLAKINPAARILLLTRLKQSNISLSTLSFGVIDQIKNTYTLPLEDKKLLSWIPAIGGQGLMDYVGRFTEVLGSALGTYWGSQMYSILGRNATDEEKICAEALAYILIHDERFSDGFYCPYLRKQVAVLDTVQRIKLGELYPAIAFALLTDPITQGKRRFTLEECERLISAHPGRNDISAAAIYFTHWCAAKDKLKEDPNAKLSSNEFCYLLELKANAKKGLVNVSYACPLKTRSAFTFFDKFKQIPESLPEDIKELMHDISEQENAIFKSI